MSKIKFSEIPIGAKVLIYKQQENIKLENELVFNITLGHLENVSPDTEVELITKCLNCKHWVDKPRDDSGDINYCDEVSISHINEELFPDMELADPETFSCSLFEQKEE